MSTSEKEGKDWVKIVALTLSIVGLLLHGLNYYNTWYVSPRAELSIICTNYWFQLDDGKGRFTINIEGIITNEGERTTHLQTKEIFTVFSLENSTEFRFVSTHSINTPYQFEKKNLIPKEAITFNITEAILSFDFEKYDVDRETFKKVIIKIIHDDGIGELSNSKSIDVD